MKLDEVSKELIKSFSFDDVLNADLTEEEYMEKAYSAVKKLATMVEELKK